MEAANFGSSFSVKVFAGTFRLNPNDFFFFTLLKLMLICSLNTFAY